MGLVVAASQPRNARRGRVNFRPFFGQVSKPLVIELCKKRTVFLSK